MLPFKSDAKHGSLGRCRVGCLAGMLLAIPSGCTFSSNADRSAEQPRLAQPFTITISSGGGFTGLYRGFRLYSTGRVERWERFAASGDSVLWVTAVDPGQIEVWGRKLEESGALSRSYRGTGNMTASVSYGRPDTTYRWSWASTGIVEDGPPELWQWYEDVEQFCIGLREGEE